MDDSAVDISTWTQEAVDARSYDLNDLERENPEAYAIENELSVRRGFQSAMDEINFVNCNLPYGTTLRVGAKDSYTRRPPEEAHVGLWKQRFGRQCGDVGCGDCGPATVIASDAPAEEASTRYTEATSHLCSICKHLNFENALRDLGIGYYRAVTLGYLRDVVSRTECAFCRLVAASIRLAFRDCGMPLEGADGRLTEIGLETRRKDADLNVQDLEIVLHPPQRQDDGDILIQRSTTPTAAAPFCGRRIDPQTVDFAVVRTWLHECEHSVAGTGHDVGAVIPIEDDFAPSRLIDVEARCVIRSTKGRYRYVALSYVWGGPQPLRLLLSNETQLASPNGLLTTGQHLPQTICDAMEATRKLGERYLWVDALCIVQDDLEFKQAELLLMSKIYSQALLTIVAASGDSVHAGLPGISNIARQATQYVEIVQGITLTNRLPTAAATVDRSTWNSRAWTFQERVLANRRLYITAHQVMFMCPHTEIELCEDVYGPAIRPSEGMRSHGREVDYRTVPHNPDGSIPPLCVNTAIYSSIVEQFCRRQISFPADVLDAFTGITDHLTVLFQGAFVMGLPVNELDTQLLWRNKGLIERRTCPDTGRDLFPSWSWAGWSGPCTGYIADNRSFPAFELQDRRTGTWTSMDQLRGVDFDSTWQFHQSDRCQFWQRGRLDETAFYYAHPIMAFENDTAFFPALRKDDTGFAGILPIRTEVINASITDPVSSDTGGASTSSAIHDLPFHRALSLLGREGNRIGTAFIPLSVAETLKPGHYDFVKIATVATSYIETIDGFLDFESCYDVGLYGVSERYRYDKPDPDSRDRIDGLLVRTVESVSYRLGVAVCHATAFENADPKRKVVLLG